MWRKASYFKSATIAALATAPIILGCALIGASGARADVVVDLDQVGNTIFASTDGGAVNLAGTTFAGSTGTGQPNIWPINSQVRIGAAGGTVTQYNFTPIGVAPEPIGTGGFTSGAIPGSNSGNFLGFVGAFNGGPCPICSITLPGGNQSGITVNVGPSMAAFTVPATTVLTVGTYPVSWGTGPNQGFELDVVPEIPLPAALPLFATGLGGLGLLGWRRKRKSRAAVA